MGSRGTGRQGANVLNFQLMGVPTLEKHGREYGRPRLTGIFERLLNWYRGDGWLIDGGNHSFDYYNLWGFVYDVSVTL